MIPFLCEIDINSSTFYCSNVGHIGEQYWHPFVVEAPRLEIGAVNGSRIGVKYGTLKLTNEPDNSEHPFGGTRYQDLLDGATIYTARFRLREAGSPLFTGGLILSHHNETTLSFTITEVNYPQFLLSHVLTENSVSVTSISTANPVSVTAAGHGLIKGQEVIFEGSTSSLNYSATNRNLYQVLDVTASNTFTLAHQDGTTVDGASLTGSIAGAKVGVPTLRPFTFGEVEHQTNVIKKTSVQIANPELDISKPLKLYEDGVLVGTNEAGNANVFTTAATQDLITSNTNIGVSGFVLSLSGTSRFGTTLSELATHLAGKLGVSADLSKL